MPVFALNQTEVEALARHLFNIEGNDAVSNVLLKQYSSAIQQVQLALHAKINAQIANEIAIEVLKGKPVDNAEFIANILAGGLAEGILIIDVPFAQSSPMLKAVFPEKTLDKVNALSRML